MLDLLTHIAALETPTGLDWELVLVDNASTDGTSEWVKELMSAQSWDFKLNIIQELRPGLNHARVTGARTAHHPWILFCDDDNLLHADYLVHWNNVLLLNNNIGAVGGRGLIETDAPLPDWFQQFSHSYALGPQANQSGIMPKGSALYGAGLFIYKQPLLELFDKGFQVVMSDRKGKSLASSGDLEWCYLIQLLGYRIYYEDKLIFRHKINSGRLTWAYYILLKRGIASGVGLLAAYRFALDKHNSNSFFVLYYIREMIISTLIHFNARIKSRFKLRNKQREIEELGLEIVKYKAASFQKNMMKAFSHYRQLKNYKLATL